MMLPPVLAARFGIHRGLEAPGVPLNSKEAIRRAVAMRPPFVEFDVIYAPSEQALRTGHPPQEPMDRLEEVLPLFEDVPTYPKIDLKLANGIDPRTMIDALLTSVERWELDFALVNLGGQGTPERFIEAEAYFCERCADTPHLRLNIDLARYRPPAVRQGLGELASRVECHVRRFASQIYSVSPEIHQEDWEWTADFCRRHGIGVIDFWLSGRPGAPGTVVRLATLQRALALEQRYPLRVYFDISPICVLEE